MQNIKLNAGSFLRYYDKFISSPFLLSLLAFGIAHLVHSTFHTLIVGVIVSAFIYSLKITKVYFLTSVKFASALCGVYAVKIAYHTVYSIVKALDWMPIFTILKAIIIVAIIFVVSSVLFYFVNLIMVLLLKLFAKNKYLNKINELLNFLFIKSPQVLLATILILLVSAILLQFLTMVDSKFKSVEGPKIPIATKVPVTIYGKDNVLIITRNYGEPFYNVFDSVKGKIVKSDKLNIGRYNPDMAIAKINENETLILIPNNDKNAVNNGGEHRNSKLKLYILNMNDFSLKDLGTHKVDMNFAYGIASLGNDEVLIAGGAGNSKQAYIYKNGKFQKIQNLNKGYIEPKILPFEGEKFLVAGSFEENNKTKLCIEMFNPSTKTFKVVYEIDSIDNSGISWSSDIFFLKKHNQLVTIGTYQEPDENYSSTSNYSKILFINASNFKKTYEKDFKFSPELHNNNQIVQLGDGNFLVTGGTSGKDERKNLNNYNKQAYVYDFDSYKLKRLGKIKSNRIKGQTILLDNGKVLIFGGHKNEWTITQMDLYTP